MSLYGGVTLPGKPDLRNIERLDQLPILQLNRMSRLGIAINREYLYELSSQLGSEMIELERQIASFIPLEALRQFSAQSANIEEELGSATINAGSAEQIRTLLFDLLHVGRDKKLKLTSGGKVSTGKKQLELTKEDHPAVQVVLDYRERSKLKNAFADSLPKKARLHPRGDSCPICELSHVEPTWRLHTEFPTTRTETGRLASRRPNLQQIPIRSELGARVRSAFVASVGTKLVSSDFSQIELRDLAHLANAKSMIKVYDQNGDIHTATAMSIFNLSKPEMVDKLQHRLPCKTINFGVAYGMTGKALSGQLATMGLYWDESECNCFIDRWYELYPEVKEYMALQHYRARRYGYVWCPWGRVRRVPEVQSSLFWIREAGLRQAGNMPIQACSAGQTKLAMGELEEHLVQLLKAGIWAWPLLSIHDQVIVEVEEEHAALVGEVMVMVLSNVMNDTCTGKSCWRVPVKSDCEIMDKWEKN